MQSRKKLFPILLVLILAALGGLWYVFNKPHRSVTTESTIPVTASEIFAAYSADETKANALYLDKALSVTGDLAEVKKNQEGKTVLVLKTDDPIFGVTCTLSEDAADLQTGKSIKVKGICSGFTSDVVLRDCIVDR